MKNKIRMALLSAACVIAVGAITTTSFAAPAVAERYYDHKAAERDTLIGIANRYLEDPSNWQALQKLNSIKDPRRLKPGSTLKIPMAMMRTQPAPGKVIAVEGPVELAGKKPEKGAIVNEGTDIKTGENGFVTIQLADGSTIAVQSKTQVKVENARVLANTGGIQIAKLELKSGRVDSAINKPASGIANRYEISTPTSNMGVRGTKFRASVDETGKTSRSEVLEGIVGVGDTVGAGSELALAAGFGTVIEDGKAAIAPVKLLAAPDLKASPTLQERALVRFKFAALDQAAAYRGQIATDANFVNLVADDVFKTPEAKFASLVDGNYFLRVRGIDKLAIEGGDATLPFKLKARPEPPFAASPANKGKVAALAVEFKWSQPTDAGSYRFQLASAADFAKVISDETKVAGTAFTPTATLAPGQYFWRVSSVRSDGDIGPFGDVQTFTLKPMPAAPNPPKEEGNKVGFSWSGEPEQKFDFQLARDEKFTQLVSESKLTLPEIMIEKPAAPGKYFMRFRGIDPDGFIGPYSATQTIEVPPPPPPPKPWWLLLFLIPLVL